MKFDCSLVLQISQHTEAERERERGEEGGRERETERERERDSEYPQMMKYPTVLTRRAANRTELYGGVMFSRISKW